MQDTGSGTVVRGARDGDRAAQTPARRERHDLTERAAARLDRGARCRPAVAAALAAALPGRDDRQLLHLDRGRPGADQHGVRPGPAGGGRPAAAGGGLRIADRRRRAAAAGGDRRGVAALARHAARLLRRRRATAATSATAGCGWATSAASTPTATSTSWTASSDVVKSGALQGLHARRSRRPCTSTRPWSRPRRSGCRTRCWAARSRRRSSARGEIAPASLRAFLVARLAPHELPTRLSCVDRLPRNDAGKVLKRELRALLTSGRTTGDGMTGAMTVTDCALRRPARHLVHRAAGVAGTAYHMALAIRFDGDAGRRRPRAACLRVVARHPALGAAVADAGGVPGLIEAAGPPAVTRRLTGRGDVLPADRGRGRGRSTLRRGPLARFTLATTGPGRHTAAVVAHHLVFDGESKDILVRDLAAALPRPGHRRCRRRFLPLHAVRGGRAGPRRGPARRRPGVLAGRLAGARAGRCRG